MDLKLTDVVIGGDRWWSGGIFHDTLRPRPRSGHGFFRSSHHDDHIRISSSWILPCLT